MFTLIGFVFVVVLLLALVFEVLYIIFPYLIIACAIYGIVWLVVQLIRKI